MGAEHITHQQARHGLMAHEQASRSRSRDLWSSSTFSLCGILAVRQGVAHAVSSQDRFRFHEQCRLRVTLNAASISVAGKPVADVATGLGQLLAGVVRNHTRDCRSGGAVPQFGESAKTSDTPVMPSCPNCIDHRDLRQGSRGTQLLQASNASTDFGCGSEPPPTYPMTRYRYGSRAEFVWHSTRFDPITVDALQEPPGHKKRGVVLNHTPNVRCRRSD